MKNDNESRDVLGDSRKRYLCPWAEIGKYRPRKGPIRLQDSLPCPLKKKIMLNNTLEFVSEIIKKYSLSLTRIIVKYSVMPLTS